MRKGQFFLLSVIIIVLAISTSLVYLIIPTSLTVKEIENINLKKESIINLNDNLRQANFLVKDWFFPHLLEKKSYNYVNKDLKNNFIFFKQFNGSGFEEFRVLNNGEQIGVSGLSTVLVSNHRGSVNGLELYYNGSVGKAFIDFSMVKSLGKYNFTTYSVKLDNLTSNLVYLSDYEDFFSSGAGFFNYYFNSVDKSNTSVKYVNRVLRNSSNSFLVSYFLGNGFNLEVDKEFEFFNSGFRKGIVLRDLTNNISKYNISFTLDCSSTKSVVGSSFVVSDACNNVSKFSDVTYFFINSSLNSSLHVLLVSYSNFSKDLFFNNGELIFSFTDGNEREVGLDLFFLTSKGGLGNADFIELNGESFSLQENFLNYEKLLNLRVSESGGLLSIVPSYTIFKSETNSFVSDWIKNRKNVSQVVVSDPSISFFTKILSNDFIYDSDTYYNNLILGNYSILTVKPLNSPFVYSTYGNDLSKVFLNQNFWSNDSLIVFKNYSLVKDVVFLLERNDFSGYLNDFFISQGSYWNLSSFSLIDYDHKSGSDFFSFSQLLRKDGVELLQVINVYEDVVVVDNFFSNLSFSPTYSFLFGNNYSFFLQYNDTNITNHYFDGSLNFPASDNAPNDLNVINNSFFLVDYGIFNKTVFVFINDSVSFRTAFSPSTGKISPYLGVNSLSDGNFSFRVFLQFFDRNINEVINESEVLFSDLSTSTFLESTFSALGSFFDSRQQVFLTKNSDFFVFNTMLSNFKGFSVFNGLKKIPSQLVDDFLNPVSFDNGLINEESVFVNFYFFNPVNQSFWINHTFDVVSPEILSYEIFNPLNISVHESVFKGLNFFEDEGVVGFYRLKVNSSGAQSSLRSKLTVSSTLRSGCVESDWFGFVKNIEFPVVVKKGVDNLIFTVNSYGTGSLYVYELFDELGDLVSSEIFSAGELKSFSINIKKRSSDSFFILKFKNTIESSQVSNVYIQLNQGFGKCIPFMEESYNYFDTFKKVLVVNNSNKELFLYQDLDYYWFENSNVFSKNGDFLTNGLVLFNPVNGSFKFKSDELWIKNISVLNAGLGNFSNLEDGFLRKIFYTSFGLGSVFVELRPNNFVNNFFIFNNTGFANITYNIKINDSEEQFFKVRGNVESPLFKTEVFSLSQMNCSGGYSYIAKKSFSRIFGLIFSCKDLNPKNSITFSDENIVLNANIGSLQNVYSYFGEDLSYKGLEQFISDLGLRTHSRGVSFDYFYEGEDINIR